MTESALIADSREISLFSLGAALLRRRWLIASIALFGAVAAAVSAFRRPPIYEASTSFIPMGAEGSRSSLSSLAGQFGFTLPSSGTALGPEFYVQLVRSRVILDSVAVDTFTVPELSRRGVTLADLLEISETGAARQEASVKALSALIVPSFDNKTNVVRLVVRTPWRSVSIAITQRLLDRLNEFNKQTRKDQAASERKFVEGRLALAADDLRAAEDRLQQFLATNREFLGSPQLVFQRDRIQRDLTMKEQVFTSLNQGYEEVRMKEVRDTPVISIIEPPFSPLLPLPRGRIKSTLIGGIVGMMLGILLVFISDLVGRVRRSGDPEWNEFATALSEARSQVAKPFRRASSRGRS
jgi:uncharacterized protein involved in exopolysaccharide biosynthesis